MRINVNNYSNFLTKSGLENEDVCKLTGLSEKTLSWILKNRYLEVTTLELIADAIGCEPGEIAAPEISSNTENVIEWVRDSEQATVTLSQRRTITRVKELAERRPEDVQIVVENKDGSIVAHIPTEWIKINPPKQYTEEQKRKLAENFRKGTP